MPNIMWLFFGPLIAAGAVLFIPRRFAKIVSGLFSLLPLLLLLFTPLEQASLHWFSALSINLSFELDAISILFAYLTAIVVPLVIFSTQHGERTFYFLSLLLQALLLGFFLSTDLLFFT
ncbi:MAG: NADH-quinone oxidoreductase subunit M, partial [Parachlamydia sp.]|nr:NADH-quinone oxidoreductase subunit M [Parachlamydia sp.]